MHCYFPVALEFYIISIHQLAVDCCNAQGFNNETALHSAAIRGQTECVSRFSPEEWSQSLTKKQRIFVQLLCTYIHCSFMWCRVDVLLSWQRFTLVIPLYGWSTSCKDSAHALSGTTALYI